MFANKVLQAITNIGTGAYQLNSTGTGAWRTWRAGFATGAQVGYYAENSDGTVWEFGYGTLTYGTPDQISRNLITSSTGSLIDWTSANGTVYVMSVPWSQALEGRYDATAAMFVPANRKPTTAVGAANRTFVAADGGAAFTFDTAAANRTATLPLISAVPIGWHIELRGLSAAYSVIVQPAGTDAVDYGAGGASLTVPGRLPFIIRSDGTQWRTDLETRSVVVQTFTASGTYTPTPGMTHCIIECIGGGGGGGSTASSASLAYAAGGGGAGEYSRKYATKATISTSQTVTIGAGGVGGVAGANPGNAGGDTSVGTICIAKGGSGGAAGSGGSPGAAGGAGGTGGTGDVKIPGGPGGNGSIMSYASVSGPLGGNGGTSAISGGPTLLSHAGAAQAGTSAAANTGAGGSSAWCLNGVNGAGGQGGSGLVIITEFCTV